MIEISGFLTGFGQISLAGPGRATPAVPQYWLNFSPMRSNGVQLPPELTCSADRE